MQPAPSAEDREAQDPEAIREVGRRAMYAFLEINRWKIGMTGQREWDIVGRAALGLKPTYCSFCGEGRTDLSISADGYTAICQDCVSEAEVSRG